MVKIVKTMEKLGQQLRKEKERNRTDIKEKIGKTWDRNLEQFCRLPVYKFYKRCFSVFSEWCMFISMFVLPDCIFGNGDPAVHRNPTTVYMHTLSTLDASSGWMTIPQKQIVALTTFVALMDLRCWKIPVLKHIFLGSTVNLAALSSIIARTLEMYFIVWVWSTSSNSHYIKIIQTIHVYHLTTNVFPKIGVGHQNGWFIMENPMKIHDLGGPPLFVETPTFITNIRWIGQSLIAAKSLPVQLHHLTTLAIEPNVLFRWSQMQSPIVAHQNDPEGRSWIILKVYSKIRIVSMGSGYLMWYYIYVIMYIRVYICLPKISGLSQKKIHTTSFHNCFVGSAPPKFEDFIQVGELLGSKVCHLCSPRGPLGLALENLLFCEYFSSHHFSEKLLPPKLKGNDIYYCTIGDGHGPPIFWWNTMELWEDPRKMLTYGSLKNSSDHIFHQVKASVKHVPWWREEKHHRWGYPKPETNSFRPWKWMVEIWLFPFGMAYSRRSAAGSARTKVMKLQTLALRSPIELKLRLARNVMWSCGNKILNSALSWNLGLSIYHPNTLYLAQFLCL